VDQRQLVEQARRGDHDAFAALVHASVARLDTAARLILRDAELARDAVQDGLFRAWRDLRSLRDPERFDAWLHRLVVNSCLDAARRKRRRPVEVHVAELPHSSRDDRLESLGERELVASVLRQLDERERSIVVMHYYLGMPLTDVAAALGVPPGTVKSRLNRALGEMRAGFASDQAAVAAASEGTVA
jgi:RNA polymerase sigma-70 factor (ECF subfamily)